MEEWRVKPLAAFMHGRTEKLLAIPRPREDCGCYSIVQHPLAVVLPLLPTL